MKNDFKRHSRPSGDESERNEETMSFTNVDIGFSDRRYSFGGPDFGSLGPDDTRVFGPVGCATCGVHDEDAACVACADRDFINGVSRSMDVDALLDSIEAREDIEPDVDEDDEADEEEEDDDTESEKAWVSSPGIRF
jgi:hypothetical protein